MQTLNPIVTIKIERTQGHWQGWQATFRNSKTMPNNQPLPLPFTADASVETVRNHVRKLFPTAAIIVRGENRERDILNAISRMAHDLGV